MKKSDQSSYLRKLIQEVITETVVGNNDIKTLKGKMVKEVIGNNNKLEIKFDDESTLIINSNSPKDLLHYHLEQGMIKTNGSNLSSHGNNPSATYYGE